MRRAYTVITVGFVSTSILGGCATGRVVEVPAAGELRIPTFQTPPDDLARSPQLQVLRARDTAGIAPTGDAVDATLLPAALAALAALPQPPKQLSRLYIDSYSVGMTFEEGGVTGRSVNASYRPGEDLYVSDPSYSEVATFDIGLIDPKVAVALVTAIQARIPNAIVDRLEFAVSSSSGFGPIWSVDVADARGSLATVYADPDGAIVAVDLD